MARKRRKTLVVCRPSTTSSTTANRRRSGVDHWKATCTERCPRGSAGGRAEKDLPAGTSPRGPPSGRRPGPSTTRATPPPSSGCTTSYRRPGGQGHPSRRRPPPRRNPPGCDPPKRAGADACATYLINKEPYLDYPTALHNGWPIATGVIEGACRHLVKDRMDITGARWGLPGAEAILKLRALRSNGDFDAYWRYHLAQERRRVHESRYLNGLIPQAA